ncbi:MAG: hypothetical protein SPL08_02965 [Pseudomonadota bacterium]|nr:hypothetical protein [Pseudomonadota bacterium]
MQGQKHKINILSLIFLVLLGAVIFCFVKQISDFKSDGHRDFAASGAKIRLAISEEECQKYPNRYYFRNLCILCPDGKPLVDGHCQRCPEGELVISNGCRRCDDDMDYITPKAECDACPNRVYEGEICKSSYRTRY